MKEEEFDGKRITTPPCKHECEGCSWMNTAPERYGYMDFSMMHDMNCTHPRWTEIGVLPRAHIVMDACRCPMGRQRRCSKCGKTMKFYKNKPKYNGGEWRCHCDG